MTHYVRQVTENDAFIDSRDLVRDIEELEELLEGSVTEEGTGIVLSADGQVDLSSEAKTLVTLKKFAEEFEQYSPDFHYGSTAVSEHQFTQYAEDLAIDCGMVDKNAPWPHKCIDWEFAADLLKQDYTEIRFGWTTFYVR